jgi:hypothetical protein
MMLDIAMSDWMVYFYETVNSTEENPALLTVPRIPAFKRVISATGISGTR